MQIFSIYSIKVSTRQLWTCLGLLLSIFTGHSVLGQSYPRKGQIDSLKLVLATLPDDTTKINTLIEMLTVQNYTAAGDVLTYAEEAIELSEKIDYAPGVIETSFEVAYYYKNQGNYLKSLQYLYDALDLCKENQDLRRMAKCHHYLGYIHRVLGQNTEALNYFNKSLEYWKTGKTQQDILMTGTVYENIATVYTNEGKDSLALDYYNHALELANIKDPMIRSARFGSLYYEIGKIYCRRGELEKAMEYQQAALQYAEKIENMILQSWIYSAISDIYLTRDKAGEALTAAERALYFAQRADSKHEMADSYQKLFRSYQKLGDHKKAFEYQSRYQHLHDSLTNLDNIHAIERLKHRHEMALIDEQYNAKIFKRNVLIGVSAGFLVVIILIYHYKNQIIKKKLELKKRELTFSIRNLKEKSELVDKVNKELEIFRQNASREIKVEKFNRILQLNIVTEEDWENFKEAFEDVYPNFLAALRYYYPNLTAADIRMAALMKMNLSIKETASVLGITTESVKKSRQRLKKKLELKKGQTVEDILRMVSC